MISSNINQHDFIEEFKHRLLSDWLPTYCNDERRRFLVEGFKHESIKISASDAYDFLRAIDHNIITDTGGGRYRMPQSKAFEQLFWEHEKNISPRPITLWLEPIITFATIARLHLDYGWPIEYIGTQSIKWEFDVIAFQPADMVNEFIAGEVKKTSKEVDKLLSHMIEIGSNGSLRNNDILESRKNAHRKCLGLLRCKAPYFWAIGPDNDNRLFEISYDEYRIAFKKTSMDNLNWDNSWLEPNI